MIDYEILLLLDPDLSEERQAEEVARVRELIEKGGGTFTRHDAWGKRKLAYEIDKKTDGIYAVVSMTADPDAVKELDRQLNLNEAVLRTKVTRPDMR